MTEEPGKPAPPDETVFDGREINGGQPQGDTPSGDKSPARPFPVLPRKEILPSSPPEKMSEIEAAIRSLSSELANLEDLKSRIEFSFEEQIKRTDSFETKVLSLFNSVGQKFDVFNGRLDREIDYARELEERARLKEAERQTALLQKALDAERAKMTLFVEDISGRLTATLDRVDEACSSLRSADAVVQDSVREFREAAVNATQGEIAMVSGKCEKFLQDFTSRAQKTLSAVRDNSVSFLRNCEKEQEALIKKIPRVKQGRFSAETFAAAAFALAGIAGALISFRLLFLLGAAG